MKKYIWSGKKKAIFYMVMCVFVCLTFIGILLHTVTALPYFGEAITQHQNEVVQRYIENGVEETGANQYCSRYDIRL